MHQTDYQLCCGLFIIFSIVCCHGKLLGEGALSCNYICGGAWQAAGKSDLEEADSGEGKKRRRRNGDETEDHNEKDPQE